MNDFNDCVGVVSRLELTHAALEAAYKRTISGELADPVSH